MSEFKAGEKKDIYLDDFTVEILELIGDDKLVAFLEESDYIIYDENDHEEFLEGVNATSNEAVETLLDNILEYLKDGRVDEAKLFIERYQNPKFISVEDCYNSIVNAR